jgi:hypothetical protein
MTSVLQSSEAPESPETARCASYSKSRSRFCLAFGRYECKDIACGHRSCGLHVVRNHEGIFCPRCTGPVRTSKH